MKKIFLTTLLALSFCSISFADNGNTVTMKCDVGHIFNKVKFVEIIDADKFFQENFIGDDGNYINGPGEKEPPRRDRGIEAKETIEGKLNFYKTSARFYVWNIGFNRSRTVTFTPYSPTARPGEDVVWVVEISLDPNRYLAECKFIIQ